MEKDDRTQLVMDWALELAKNAGIELDAAVKKVLDALKIVEEKNAG